MPWSRSGVKTPPYHRAPGILERPWYCFPHSLAAIVAHNILYMPSNYFVKVTINTYYFIICQSCYVKAIPNLYQKNLMQKYFQVGITYAMGARGAHDCRSISKKVRLRMSRRPINFTGACRTTVVHSWYEKASFLQSVLGIGECNFVFGMGQNTS